MSMQETKALIIDAFPDTHVDPDGKLRISKIYQTSSPDPFKASFDPEGNVEIHNPDSTSLSLDLSTLSTIAADGYRARRLYKQWKETSSGAKTSQ